MERKQIPAHFVYLIDWNTFVDHLGSPLGGYDLAKIPYVTPKKIIVSARPIVEFLIILYKKECKQIRIRLFMFSQI